MAVRAHRLWYLLFVFYIYIYMFVQRIEGEFDFELMVPLRFWIAMQKGSAAAVRDDRPGIPQLFTAVPSLNEAASYLAGTTSIFTRCFPDISSNFPELPLSCESWDLIFCAIF